MNELPSRDAFGGCLHSFFHILEDNAAGIGLELVEVSELKTFSRQQVFSLSFAGPSDCFLAQKIYHLAHAQLGEMELFLVPTGRNTSSFLYEVVFNHLLPGEVSD